MTFILPENLKIEQDFYIFYDDFIYECLDRSVEIDQEKYKARVSYAEVNTWVCTDTLVGCYSHYLDGEFVAISYKSARKDDIHFFWVSKEHMRKFIDFLLSIEINKDECLDRCSLVEQLTDADIDTLLTPR